MSKSVKQIRKELQDEIGSIARLEIIDGGAISIAQVTSALHTYTDKLVERALLKFEAGIADKKRQIALGELADEFFRRARER